MNAIQCLPTVDGFVFTWAELPFEISLSRIRESTQGTQAELHVRARNGPGEAKTLTQRRVNLLTSKASLAKELKAKHDLPWITMLEQVSVLALRALRQGEPIESLQPTDEDHPAWFVLNPLLLQKNPTIIYGPGDSMKSYFVLYCALLLASGVCGPQLSVAPTPWKVLVLDYEMSLQDTRGRVKLLQAGDPRLTGVPNYRRCYYPLADEIGELKKVVSEGEYDVLIIDSLAMAAGGQELERADSAIRFNAALRSLNCTSLIIGHTPKPQEDEKERHLYGSVFFSNLGRNSWECRREGNTIGLYHKKHNLSPEHAPLAFHLAIDDESCTVTQADLSEEPALHTGLKLQERLALVLKEKPGQTVKELALAVNKAQDVIRGKLNACKTKFISVDGKWECLA